MKFTAYSANISAQDIVKEAYNAFSSYKTL
jgi:hypothetical protein